MKVRARSPTLVQLTPNSVFHGPEALASRRSLLEMQNFRFLPSGAYAGVRKLPQIPSTGAGQGIESFLTLGTTRTKLALNCSEGLLLNVVVTV